MRYNLTGLSIADTRSPIEIHTQPGGPGVVYSKALAIAAHIGPCWSRIEFVAIPPGENGIGSHTQSTDEISLVIRGKGELTTNGSPHVVTPGMLVIAPQGTTHEIRNTGDSEPLTLLAVELLVSRRAVARPPAFLNLLSGLRESDAFPTVRIGERTVRPLVASANLSGYFAAPWSTLILVTLPPRAAVEEYIEPVCDQLLFVVHGLATIHIRKSSDPDEEMRIDANNAYHQSVLVPRGVPHRITNQASENSPLTVACLNVQRVAALEVVEMGVWQGPGCASG